MDSERKGMGLLSWMALLFVGAKLFGFINWSWWLVLIPVWIMLGLLLVILTILGVAYLIDKRNGL